MTIRLFEEYLEEGTAKRQSPDISRARSLRKEAEDSHEILRLFIDKMGMDDRNANYVIKNAYDINNGTDTVEDAH